MDNQQRDMWIKFESKLEPPWKYKGTNKYGNRVYDNQVTQMWKIASIVTVPKFEEILTSYTLPVPLQTSCSYELISQDFTTEFFLHSEGHDDILDIVDWDPIIKQSLDFPPPPLNEGEWVDMVKASAKGATEVLNKLQETHEHLAEKWGHKQLERVAEEKFGLPYSSEVGATYIQAIEAWKVVQYVDNRMYVAIITKNHKDFDMEALKKEQHWHSAFSYAVATALGAMKVSSGAITSGQQLSNKEGMHKIVKNPAATGQTVHDATLKDCKCPMCVTQTASIYQMVQTLNDTHKWTREQIADWLDTLDEQPVFHPVEQGGLQSSAKVVTFEPDVQEKVP